MSHSAQSEIAPRVPAAERLKQRYLDLYRAKGAMIALVVQVAMHEYGKGASSVEDEASRTKGIRLYEEYHDSGVHDSQIPKHGMVHYPGRLQVDTGYKAALRKWNKQWNTPQFAANTREEGFAEKAVELGISTNITEGVELLNEHTGRKERRMGAVLLSGCEMSDGHLVWIDPQTASVKKPDGSPGPGWALTETGLLAPVISSTSSSETYAKQWAFPQIIGAKEQPHGDWHTARMSARPPEPEEFAIIDECMDKALILKMADDNAVFADMIAASRVGQ